MRPFARFVVRVASVLGSWNPDDREHGHDFTFLGNVARACAEWRDVEDKRLRAQADKQPAKERSS